MLPGYSQPVFLFDLLVRQRIAESAGKLAEFSLANGLRLFTLRPHLCDSF